MKESSISPEEISIIKNYMKSKIAQPLAILAGAGLMFNAAVLFATDDTAPNQPPSTPSTAIKDKEVTDPASFCWAAYAINQTGIEMGRLARERGQSQSVRDLGERMVHDYTLLENKIKELARTNGVVLPDLLDAPHQKMLDGLAALSGASFDQHYLEVQIKCHQKAIPLFQLVAAENQDRALRAYAADNIPLLQQDLHLAQNDSKIMNQPAGVSQGK
jgi:putative membrane protein